MHRSPRLLLLLAVLAGVLLVTAITPVPQARAATVLDQHYAPVSEASFIAAAMGIDSTNPVASARASRRG